MRPEFGLSIYEIYDMKACRITTLLQRGGLFLLSSRTSRQVRPEFGLPIYEIFDMKAGLPTYEILDMEACRITTLFSGRGEGGRKKTQGKKGKGEGVCFCYPAAP